MKFAAVVLFVFFSVPVLAATRVVVSAMSASEYADTEAATNIVLVVDRARLDRVVFAMELTASATNCLEVAVGMDAEPPGACPRILRQFLTHPHRDPAGTVPRILKTPFLADLQTPTKIAF